MVVMGFAAAALTGIWHERRGTPLNRTVQAPHWPSPQPYLVPIRPSSSRSAVRSGVSGSQWTVCRLPLISSSIGFAIILRSACGIPQAGSPSATSYHRGISGTNRRNRRTRLPSVATVLCSSESSRNAIFAMSGPPWKSPTATRSGVHVSPTPIWLSLSSSLWGEISASNAGRGFNLCNHPNFGLPNTLITSSTLGVSNDLAGQEPSRFMPCALRFEF